jgi:hypothetical protein
MIGITGNKTIKRKLITKHINVIDNLSIKKIEKRQHSVIFMTVEEMHDNYFWYHQKELYLSKSHLQTR